MVSLAEVLVIMTDGLKIVRIRARNVPRVGLHGHKRLDDEFQPFLSRSMKDTVSRARCAGALSCWNTKKSSVDNLHMSGSGF